LFYVPPASLTSASGAPRKALGNTIRKTARQDEFTGIPAQEGIANLKLIDDNSPRSIFSLNNNLETFYMNRKEFAEALAKKTGSSNAAADRAIGAVVEVISEALKKGDKVSLVGFGTFEVRKRAARTGRNPQTGKEIKIKAAKVPAFKAGASLKATVNGAKK
jgi:DNA-binding protein HU-beta